MNSVPIDLEKGEGFFRISIDEDGTSRFICGLFPSDEDSTEVTHDDLIAVFMAGIASMVQNDVDTILHAGTQYLIEGNQPFDFIVGDEDHEFFDNLTDEQLELMRMEIKGEA